MGPKPKATKENGAPSGGKKFKFVDCTKDAMDAVSLASKQVDDVIPDGFGKYAKVDCEFHGCMLGNSLPLHYHCLREGCGIGIG